jgi:hypothetical protein
MKNKILRLHNCSRNVVKNKNKKLKISKTKLKRKKTQIIHLCVYACFQKLLLYLHVTNIIIIFSLEKKHIFEAFL